jgi:hypothetical protein
MNIFDGSSALCQVFIYKEGFLSALAYDLRINVTSFLIELGRKEQFIKARFDAQSLRVDCAMVDGSERPDILSLETRKEIEHSIIKKVLETETYREIFLLSSSVKKEDSTYQVKGLLTLHGMTREITFPVKAEGNYLSAYVRLLLNDFGIRPFSALFGAIRVKPDILIRVIIPKPADNVDPLS